MRTKEVDGPLPKSQIYRLKVTLRDVKPPVWRRVELPGNVTLAELHSILQTAMGWFDSHLHEFEIDGVEYGVLDDAWDYDEKVRDESKVRLDKVADEGTRIRYTYDFGDNWRHDVVVEKVLPAEDEVRYPRCLAGKRATPPEDVGGDYGYAEFCEAMADPSTRNMTTTTGSGSAATGTQSSSRCPRSARRWGFTRSGGLSLRGSLYHAPRWGSAVRTRSTICSAHSIASAASSGVIRSAFSSGYSACWRRRRITSNFANARPPRAGPNCATAAARTAMWPPVRVARRPCIASAAEHDLRVAS